jgi:hypothetical protein
LQQASAFPVQQSFANLLLQAVASFPQQDFPAVAPLHGFPSFTARSLASLSLQQVMAFFLFLVSLEQQEIPLPSFAWQQDAARSS